MLDVTLGDHAWGDDSEYRLDFSQDCQRYPSIGQQAQPLPIGFFLAARPQPAAQPGEVPIAITLPGPLECHCQQLPAHGPIEAGVSMWLSAAACTMRLEGKAKWRLLFPSSVQSRSNRQTIGVMNFASG